MTEISGIGVSFPRVGGPSAPAGAPSGAPTEAPADQPGGMPVTIPQLTKSRIAKDAGEVITPRDWSAAPSEGSVDDVKLDPEMFAELNKFTENNTQMATFEAEADRLMAPLQTPARTGPLKIPASPQQVVRQKSQDVQVDAALAILMAPPGVEHPPGQAPTGPLAITDPLIAGADAALTSREARGTPRWIKAVSGLRRAHQLISAKKSTSLGRLNALKLHIQPLTMAIGMCREALARATNPKDIRRLSEKLSSLQGESSRLSADMGEATKECSDCDVAMRGIEQSLAEMGVA